MNPTIAWLRRHRVAVLKGGWSRERAISLKTGHAIEQALERLKIPFIGIDVKKNVAAVLKQKRVEFAYIALHGTFGEDGQVQSLLESLKIPYTGSCPLGSSLAMDKNLSKRLFMDALVPTAPWTVLTKGMPLAPLKPWFKKTAFFVKPSDQGSAIGASRVDRYAQLPSALRACFRVSDKALVEKFIPGRELTVGVLGNRALPVVEIIPQHKFYDFHSKYAAGGSRHLVPAQLPKALTKQIQKISLEAFRALRCCVYGRIDVILTKKKEIFVLEVNTIPGMTATSLLPDAARAAGIGFDQLVLKIAELSLKERGKR